MRISRLLIWLLILLTCLQLSHYSARLPDSVATHFDGAGQADGWSSRNEFLLMSLALAAGMGLLFLGITGWLDRIPDAYINLPNKEYWLAPGRRAATLDAFGATMEWLGAATLVLLLGITQLTIETNLVSRQDPGANAKLGDGLWLLIGGYTLFMVVWLVVLLRRSYARVPRP